jgi:hypothetical protein
MSPVEINVFMFLTRRLIFYCLFNYQNPGAFECMSCQSQQTKKVIKITFPKLCLKERLPALVRDLFTFSSKVMKSFIIVWKNNWM